MEAVMYELKECQAHKPVTILLNCVSIRTTKREPS